MYRKPVLLHVHPGASSFVVKDRRLLSSAFDVRDNPFVWTSKWQVPLLMARQAAALLFTRWKIVAVQFAGYHALLPALIARLTGRTCIIIAGGTDCVAFPSIGYGNFARQPLAWATRRAYALAHHVVPVHRSLVSGSNTYQRNDPQEQGILAHMPGLTTPITVVANGYDAVAWALGTGARDIDVISIASNDRRPTTLMLKGVDLLVEVARMRPHLSFVVVGLNGPPLTDVPGNISFRPPVPNASLQAWYQRARIYAQLSLSEGFPNALCEAMLCGCVPLVSAVGAMPDIVAEAGVIIHERNADAVATGLDGALAGIGANSAARSRDRIAANFTEARRAEELLAVLRRYLG